CAIWAFAAWLAVGSVWQPARKRAAAGRRTLIVRRDLKIDIFQDRLLLNSGVYATWIRFPEHDGNGSRWRRGRANFDNALGEWSRREPSDIDLARQGKLAGSERISAFHLSFCIDLRPP